ncbi:MAG TPA: phenylacetate--CoA ligase [Chloroflexota bacterium]
MTPIWDAAHETMPRPTLKKLQLERLQALLKRVYATVPFYRQQLRDAGVSPDDVRSLDDLSRLPFTTKRDLRDNYPYGLLAVPADRVARMQASGGTTGKPTLSLYSASDLAMWAEMMARVLTSGGATPGDRVHIAYSYGLFTGGFGFHDGAERIGAAVIPVSGGQTKRQVMLIEDLGSTVLCCTPSYALFLAEKAVEMGVDLGESSLRLGFFGAEPWSERTRAAIESRLGITALDCYGLSEVIGPGVAGECHHKDGLHVNEDHFLPEVVDLSTGESLPDGKTGELVITTLTKEAMPLIRYRTGDITKLTSEQCACGRTLIRMGRVSSRTDDMVIVRGINVFPSQIESLLHRFEILGPEYQIVVDRKHEMDDLEIRVEVSWDAFPEVADEFRRLETVEQAIREELASLLGISARVRLLEPGSLRREEPKARRVVDLRDV